MNTPTKSRSIACNPAKLASSFNGHASPVIAMAFSADRKWLASASSDGEARVWAVGSGRCHSFAGFGKAGEEVRSLAISEKGTSLAIGGSSGQIAFFDLSDRGGRGVRFLRGGAESIDALAISPDGMIAGAGSDARLRIWDPAQALASEPRIVLPGHTRPIASVAFSPGGKRLATASRDGTIRTWTLGGIRPSQITSLPHGREAQAVAYSPDGKCLASAGPDQAIWVWDLAAARPTVRYSLAGPKQGTRLVQFSGDGQVLITVSAEGGVRNWNLARSLVCQQWQLPSASVATGASFALTADGRYLARGLECGTVELFRVAEKR